MKGSSTASETEDLIEDTFAAIDNDLSDISRRVKQAGERGTFAQEKAELTAAVARVRLRMITLIRSRDGSRAWFVRPRYEAVGDNVMSMRRR